MTLPRVTEILQALGLTSYRPHPMRDYYMGRGSALHKAIELDIRDELDEASLHTDIAAAFQGWRRFRDEHRVTPWHAELAVESEALGYQAHLDFVGLMDDRPALIDWKNVKGSVDDRAVTLQLAAYDLIYVTEVDAAPALDTLVVLLRPDGTYKPHPVKARQHRDTWQAIVRAHRALTRWESL